MESWVFEGRSIEMMKVHCSIIPTLGSPDTLHIKVSDVERVVFDVLTTGLYQIPH